MSLALRYPQSRTFPSKAPYYLSEVSQSDSFGHGFGFPVFAWLSRERRVFARVGSLTAARLSVGRNVRDTPSFPRFAYLTARQFATPVESFFR